MYINDRLKPSKLKEGTLKNLHSLLDNYEFGYFVQINHSIQQELCGYGICKETLSFCFHKVFQMVRFLILQKEVKCVYYMVQMQ